MRPYAIAIACAAALAAAAGTASAQQSYRCVDPAGNVVYTERPCASMGLRTEKSIKDIPNVAPAASTTTRPAEPPPAKGGARPAGPYVETRSIMCGDKPTKCERGTTLTCGGQSVRCEGD